MVRPTPAEKSSRNRPKGRSSVEPQTDLFRLFVGTRDGVWISDPSGRILFWNEAAEAILGYSAQEVVGRKCADIFDGRDIHGNRLCIWPCALTMERSGELLQHFDMATRTKKGRPLWINISSLAMPSDRDQLPTIVHLFRDVTKLHQIEALTRQQLTQTWKAANEATLRPVRELSKRELEVVNLMRAGATTAVIADQLCISRGTVRSHIQNILSKLKVHSRLEVVTYVTEIARRRSATLEEGTGPTPEATNEVARLAGRAARKKIESISRRTRP